MPTIATSWRRMIGDQIDLGHDPIEAAQIVLESIPKKDRDAYLLSLLVGEAESTRRSRVRTKERRVAAKIAAGGNPIKARRELVDSGFHLPNGGGYVLQLEATAADHLAYAGWLREHAEGTLRSAVFHEECADAITSAGVRCLADLDPALRPGEAA